MANIFDYLLWRGDLPFKKVCFNNVDSLILCRLSYIPFDNIVPETGSNEKITISEAAERFFSEDRNSKEQQVLLKDDTKLLKELSKSERFKNLGLTRYVNTIDIAEEKQFSAVTVILDEETSYVAFRGTDNTLVGWRDDFNMVFITPVPAQRDAVAYLEETALAVSGNLLVGGHSKGGNLAVYATAYCNSETKRRIQKIYNNDGPGFDSSVIADREYMEIKDKVLTFVPQSSVVGMLLEHEEEYTIVHSTQVGIMQHDLYSWEVTRDGFVHLKEITNSSKFIDHTLKEWVSNMTLEQRSKLSDAIFEILGATDAKTFSELSSGLYKNAGIMMKSLRNTDEETRKLIYEAISLLIRAAKDSLPLVIQRPMGDGLTKQE